MHQFVAAALGLWLFAAPGAARTEATDARPDQAVAPIVDNERVTVWDITWTKGAPDPLLRRDDDYVVLYLSKGTLKLTGPDGASATTQTEVGQVVFQAKGSVKAEAAVSAAPVRARVIDLHDGSVAPYKNSSSYPKAFPRRGSKRLLDNARVVVWDYTFTSGSPSPMHFHDKDVVVTYMADGALKSTTADGQSQTNENTFGLTKYNLGNRTHTEQLVRGKSRVIAVELK